MDVDSRHPTLAAGQLDEGAHALRNDIATLRTAARLVDDAEVADAIGQALDDLHARLERAVVAARIDLDRSPGMVELAADQLVRLGAARARREGASVDDVVVRIEPEIVRVPGPWAERLIADVVHRADEQWLVTLAAVCGATITHDAEGAVVTFR